MNTKATPGEEVRAVEWTAKQVEEAVEDLRIDGIWPDTADMLEQIAAERESLRARAERAEAERDGWKDAHEAMARLSAEALRDLEKAGEKTMYSLRLEMEETSCLTGRAEAAELRYESAERERDALVKALTEARDELRDGWNVCPKCGDEQPSATMDVMTLTIEPALAALASTESTDPENVSAFPKNVDANR